MTRRRSSKRHRKLPSALSPWLALGLALVLLLAFSHVVPTQPLRRWWSERQGLDRVEGHAPLILAAARENGLDPNLLAGVMMVESRGHVGAESTAGALGLFQLMLPTAAEQALQMGLAAPSKTALLTDAGLNTRLGARYLAWLFPRFDGDEQRVLIAYNAGPGRLKRWTEEAGSYAAWRDARELAGDSAVLAYARDVQHYRQRFADRGAIAPSAAGILQTPSAGEQPTGTQEKPSPAPGFVGPPAPNSQR